MIFYSVGDKRIALVSKLPSKAQALLDCHII